MLERPARVVLVEDEASDVLFMKKAFERGRLEFEVSDVASGQALFGHLRDAAARNEPPDVVLLDLNLPTMSGREILSELRGGEVFPLVVVIVLTSSSYQREVTALYGEGANAYVTKPARLTELDALVVQIEDFWLGMAHLPYS